MAQLTIYLDEEAHRLVLDAAKREGTSLSKWAGKRLVKAAKPEAWPEGFFELFGAIGDETFREPVDLDSHLDGEEVAF